MPPPRPNTSWTDYMFNMLICLMFVHLEVGSYKDRASVLSTYYYKLDSNPKATDPNSQMIMCKTDTATRHVVVTVTESNQLSWVSDPMINVIHSSGSAVKLKTIFSKANK